MEILDAGRSTAALPYFRPGAGGLALIGPAAGLSPRAPAVSKMFEVTESS
jgi:hypothetical protein